MARRRWTLGTLVTAVVFTGIGSATAEARPAGVDGRIVYKLADQDPPSPDDDVYSVRPDACCRGEVLDRGITPEVSPDGRYVAQRTQDSGYLQVVDLSTGDPVRVAFAPHKAHWPAWSPNGKRIAYLEDNRRVCIADLEGDPSVPACVDDGGPPDWLPDGSGVVFQRGTNIVTWTARGVEQLCGVCLEYYRQSVVSWSPKRDAIVYTRPDHRQMLLLERKGDAWVERILYVPDAGGVSNPVFSPSGDFIAYRRIGGIWVMRADGTENRKLTHEEAQDGAMPFDWAVASPYLDDRAAGSWPWAFTDEVRFTWPLDRHTGGGRDISYEYGYVGPPANQPPGQVRGLSSSQDRYYCPSGQALSSALVLGDDLRSQSSGFGTSGPDRAYGASTVISVRNWSFSAMTYRVIASCTFRPEYFPFRSENCPDLKARRCGPLGSYAARWESLLQVKGDRPDDPEWTQSLYTEILPLAFCWDPTARTCPPAVVTGRSSAAAGRGARAAAAPVARTAAVQARRGGNRFRLRNGDNLLEVRFRHAHPARPPAIFLKGAKGCRSQRLGTAIHGTVGRLRLVLRCRGLRGGGAARVTVTKAITRTFPVRRGTGRIRVRLDRPPGVVEPYAAVGYGRARSRCREVGHRLSMQPRRFDLRITARCGPGQGRATGRLDVGGLLVADR